jgi:hypothetical protein
MQFPGKRAVFAPFMEDTALLWDKKQGVNWLEMPKTGGIGGEWQENIGLRPFLAGIRT